MTRKEALRQIGEWLDVPLSLLPDGVEDTLLAYAQCFYFGD